MVEVPDRTLAETLEPTTWDHLTHVLPRSEGSSRNNTATKLVWLSST